MSMKHEYIIGIDTGVNTGLATWNVELNTLVVVDCVAIHTAMDYVLNLSLSHKVKVKFEDARLRKWFGNAGREQLQGAGSIKRDAKVWEDFLTDHKIEFTPVAPKNNKTKLDALTFKNITKWEGKTNEHSRDAAMLVWGR